ncbi:MAG: Glu/Leu/Phe/Val dehydrogenase [Planctomycetes bacterium]|nr:Glu/Leu/Phe/Val dehydrogenase [Planctomycetota bacterium]
MPDSTPEQLREQLATEGVEEQQAPSPALDEENPFSSMMARFDEAAARLGLSPDAYAVLRRPDRQFKFAIPVQYPDGAVKVHKGFRIRHNLSLGPCLGGLRLEEGLRREELAALAGWATWKNAALGIPFGGSAGGVDYDPRGQASETTEAVVRRYTAGLLDLLGPEQDIISPDLHCNEQIMAWCLDTYSMHVRHTDNAVVVGKPEGLAGTHGRDCAVGRSAIVLMERRLAVMNIDGPVDIVVQGAGTVGAQVMREAAARGHRIIAAGDLRAAAFRKEGLDVEALLAHRAERGTIEGFSGGDTLDPKELITLSCDVLIPAATADTIHSRNAEKIQAKLIVEAANGPTSKRADGILSDRGIPVVPDLLGNAGSAVIAYFEWVQNRMGYQWTEEMVFERLDRMVIEAYDKARKVAKEHQVGLRLATCILGVKRVAYFDNMRGLYA